MITESVCLKCGSASGYEESGRWHCFACHRSTPVSDVAERLAKLREAVKNRNSLLDQIAYAAIDYILSLDQPAPESNKCASDDVIEIDEHGKVTYPPKAKCAECERKDVVALQIFNGGSDMAIGEIRYLLAQVFPLTEQPAPNTAN